MMKTRGYNFGAGPATLPQTVLETAQAELLNWQGTGMSVMECSHRSPEFLALLADTEQRFRELLAVPENYSVLFLTQPARMQFAMVPMNFLHRLADFLVTGTWSAIAAAEAKRFGHVNRVADGGGGACLSVPKDIVCSSDADYFYYTPNETLTGTAVHDIPEVGEVPLVADMTSCILSAPIDISRFALIFAGSQKNIGPAGLTLVIIRDDFLKSKKTNLATMLDYQTHVDNHSNYATPATFQCYMANLMCRWLKAQGGLTEMAARNQEKSSTLYNFIDKSDFYHCPVAIDSRSTMNVAFTLADSALDDEFLAKAKAQGLLALKGHRSIGGMRASIYNSMPLAGVLALIEFMQQFAAEVS